MNILFCIALFMLTTYMMTAWFEGENALTSHGTLTQDSKSVFPFLGSVKLLNVLMVSFVGPWPLN
jgi:hypothetical protein